MKTLFKLFVAIVAISCAVVSCNKENGGGSGEPEKGSITIPTGQDIAPVFDDKGGTKTVTFTTTADWTASVINTKADGWITLNPQSGSKGENTLFITTAANTSADERSATIEIKCGEAKRQIIATQKQKDALTVTKSKFEVGAKGEIITIEVKANVDYVVSIDDKCVKWIDKVQTKSMVTTTVQLVIAENVELEKREGKVTISSGNLSENIYIYQAGAAPAIVITQSEYVVPSAGETIEVQVSHNVSATCVMPQGVNWISEVQTKAMSTNSFYFAIAENTGLENREAEIKFINTENGLSESVRVIQMQKDELVVAKSEYEINDKGGEIVVRVGHNVDFDIEIDGKEWISKVEPKETKAFVQEDITFNIAQNLTYDGREGSITFTSKDKSKQQIVKVFQGQINAIILDEKSRIIPAEGETFSVKVNHNVDVTVKPLVSWLHQVQTTKALVSDTIELAADANTSYDNREGKVVFINTLKGVSDTLMVTQLQKDAIVVAKSEYNLTSKGGQIEVTIGHNVEYDTEISESWITEASTKSFVTKKLYFIVAENPTYDNRQATITFTSKDKTKKQVVTVYQGQINAIILGRKSQVVSAAGESFEVGVNSNVPLSVKTTASWLQHTQTKALIGNTLMFTASANTSYYERTAEAIVYNTASGVSDTLKVTQLQKDAIVAAKSEYYIARKGDDITVELGHNVNFFTNINVGWITETTTKSFITDKLTFTISENTTGSDRTGLITFTSYDGTCSQIVKVVQNGSDITDLSFTGTANCYVVNKVGTYKFKATVKGNSTESVGTPANAEVLWESFGTEVKPNVGDVVASASYNSGYITFTTPTSLANGNAVIAVKDASGTILWSWHIWVCKDWDPVATEHVYANNAGTMMDRNLGALSATPGDGRSIGLIYQWGRKDPFLSAVSFTSENIPGSSTEWPTFSDGQYSMEYAISHPMTHIPCKSSYRYDWCNLDMDERWNSTKKMHDPCPIGWKVTDSSFWTTSWGTASKESKYYRTVDNIGIILPASISGKEAWYPYGGMLGPYDTNAIGKQDKATQNHIWTNKPYRSYGNYFAFFFFYASDYNYIDIENTWGGNGSPAYSFSVRCQKQ